MTNTYIDKTQEQLPITTTQVYLTPTLSSAHIIYATATNITTSNVTITVTITKASPGVPAVYINTLKLGYINMLEDYGLVKQTIDTQQALQYGLDFLTEPNTSEKYQTIKQKLLAEKIDVTKYIVEIIEKHA